jgi:hypothetical protein
MTPMPQAHRYTLAAYRVLLRLFPAGFRVEFEEEMVTVFAARLEAEAVGGAAALGLLLREAGGLVSGGLQAQFYARRKQPALLAAAGGSDALVETGRPLYSLMKVILIVVGLGLLAFAAYFIYMMATFSFEGPPRVQEVVLGDVNGDGLADAYLAVAPDGEPYLHIDYLLLNQGDGLFHDSGQEFDDRPSFSAALADVDADGDLDVITGQYGVRVYLNDGRGLLASHAILPVPDGVYKMDVALADLNGDGRHDIFGAGCCGGGAFYSQTDQRPLLPGSLVWLNNGDRPYFSRGQDAGQVGSHAVALADLNGDGLPDAFLANGTTLRINGAAVMPTPMGQSSSGDGPNPAAEVDFESHSPDTVWFNDGQGHFSDSGQRLGASEGLAVALGDVNGDGFPDAVVGNRGADEVWLNDGRGNFSDSGQRLGRDLTRTVFLADLDGDGDLDLVTGGEETARVWFNDGHGRFTDSRQRIEYDAYQAVTLGDATGDGIADIFVAAVGSYQVWRGQGDGRFVADERQAFLVTSDE